MATTFPWGKVQEEKVLKTDFRSIKNQIAPFEQLINQMTQDANVLLEWLKKRQLDSVLPLVEIDEQKFEEIA